MASRVGNRRRTTTIVGAIVVALIVAVAVTKVVAERAADRVVESRQRAIAAVLEGARPEDFLALGAKRADPGSLASRVAAEPGFLEGTRAEAARTRLFFEPRGWWSGFTERCLVAVITADGVSFETPKRACVQVR